MRTEVKKHVLGLLIGILSVSIIPRMTVFAPPLDGGGIPVFSPPPIATPSYEESRAAFQNPWGVEPIHIGNVDSEILWLARAMFSESKRHDEQDLVGWVVRNRLETQFRGCTTYKECVLDPFQFSAFLPGQPKFTYYTGLTETSNVPGWQRTLALAFYIRHADERLRPFGRTVRHFYSEQSMIEPGVAPDWVGDLSPVAPWRNLQLDERRFRFYAGVQ